MKSTPRSLPPEAGDALFLFGYVAVYLLLAAGLRGLLLYLNRDLAAAIPVADIVTAFAVGVRFDLIVACVLASPLVIALLLPGGLRRRRVALGWLIAVGSLTLFAGVVEPEFYRQFHTRLNSIAIHYMQEDPATVSSMLWHGFPVVRYLLIWVFLCTVYAYLLVLLNRWTTGWAAMRYRPLLRIPVFIVVLALAVAGGRGTLRSGPPLRWGDAFHSAHLFANHLALNGSYTLAKAANDINDQKGREWLDRLPEVDATTRLRNLLLTPRDELIGLADYPVLRRHTPLNRLPRAPKNIVLIIMESFSGAFTGALGNDQGVTPHFDRLAQQGLLFDRFFSNGTHTHQGMFATVACFPNLPGFEYLMQQPEGQHQFSGLPAVLRERGFNDLYVYNGHFAWDNQEGFFRNQGMTNFVGRDDYENPVFIDETWGVSDQDMFDRAAKELNALPADKPFYAVLQTLSNHTPYALPADLPVDRVTGFGDLDEHLTAQRYSDWALGRFFDQVKNQPWYQDTVFVVVGDHGFSVAQQLSEIDLLRFRVPMLILGPGIRETYGAVNHTVASQTDVVPTVVSLLGEPFVHQCWGRDLLALPQGDQGFGVIKPSGSDQTVALLRGGELFVKPPQGDPQLGSYRLSPAPQFVAHGDTDSSEYASDLTAYIQSAMRSLIDDRSGLLDSAAGSGAARDDSASHIKKPPDRQAAKGPHDLHVRPTGSLTVPIQYGSRG
ncbi:LTA synthase family protein [Thiosocius teredinicola]|uniref:LTA synthase family protein n=1 Tax=Thiosocius teredinicola TaxID=1973002 RepID=UPI00099110FE